MTRLLLPFVCFVICMNAGFGQGPTVLSVFPVQQEVAAPADAIITISFDRRLDHESVNLNTVKVFGRWSGPSAGSVSLSSIGTHIFFVPDEPFFAGEWITVNLTKGIKSDSGENMTKGYNWNYWIATAPGILKQEFAGQIQLRLPGEAQIQTYGAYAGDLNNDGFSDLTVINETADDLRVLFNDGAGNYSSFDIFPMGNLSPSPNEGADFNNDGEIDLAVGTVQQNKVRVLFGTGQGTFTDMENYTTGNGPRGLVILDCNGDGYDDIFTTNRLSDNMSLLTNNGDGSFSVTTLNSTGIDETACAVADADNDGIPDIFIGMFTSQELGLLLGDGEGNFQLSDKISVQGSPWMIAAGDLNGDGNADVVSANSFGNVTAVSFGDGQGGLAPAQHYNPNNALFPLAIDLGDLDGDGDLDMVSSNFSSVNYTVYENDGSGQFSVAAILPASANASCAILHDRDNDGDLDISGTDEGDDVLIIFNNPGIVDATNDRSAAEISLKIFPNPFSASTGISFTLRSKRELSIGIADLKGNVVKSLFRGRLSAGQHLISWDGENDAGKLCAAGIYFCLLKLGAVEITQKLSFLRN